MDTPDPSTSPPTTRRTTAPGSRITVRHGDVVVADTRHARVAVPPGRSPFFLLPREAIAGQLRPTEDPAVFDLQLPSGVLEGIATIEPDVASNCASDSDPEADDPDGAQYVRLCPTDLRATGARWEEPVLRFFEEGRPSFPHARDPGHRVDVLPLSQPASVWLDDQRIAQTDRAQLVLEKGLPARVYMPADAFEGATLRPATSHPRTVCPYKGVATYFDLVAGSRTLAAVAWGYDRDDPHNWLLPSLHGHRALYPRPGLRVVIDDR